MSRFALKVNGHLDPGHILSVLAVHALPGMDIQDPSLGTHTSPIALASGHHLVTLGFTPNEVLVDCPSSNAADRSELGARITDWLDLATDLTPIQALLGADAVLAPLISSHPWRRLTGYLDGFEAACATVLGQHVSLAAARTFGSRLLQAFGEQGPGGSVPLPHGATADRSLPRGNSRDSGADRFQGPHTPRGGHRLRLPASGDRAEMPLDPIRAAYAARGGTMDSRLLADTGHGRQERTRRRRPSAARGTGWDHRKGSAGSRSGMVPLPRLCVGTPVGGARRRRTLPPTGSENARRDPQAQFILRRNSRELRLQSGMDGIRRLLRVGSRKRLNP
ncbi:AlkA N-terminal domain-containing protein [Paeniglutamicibacter cryotolerans]|uniref:DNA-3-methyladenine glycosylase AlkA N-terminal domain-containing protein n=1 Tax=Paeniglutamicibacter cryotolerans TaxID=670079 RepID=A0A839QQI0_9MICC|nr:hypothetical protein [Paeniglutamicibacter cryotolerans]